MNSLLIRLVLLVCMLAAVLAKPLHDSNHLVQDSNEEGMDASEEDTVNTHAPLTAENLEEFVEHLTPEERSWFRRRWNQVTNFVGKYGPIAAPYIISSIGG